MNKDAYKLFKAMYIILDELWEENKEDDLRIYVSDADPLFCDDGKSMDPVVFEDFKAMHLQKESCEISDYDFILYYLENLDPYYGDIRKYFVSIPKDECEAKIIALLNS